MAQHDYIVCAYILDHRVDDLARELIQEHPDDGSAAGLTGVVMIFADMRKRMSHLIAAPRRSPKFLRNITISLSIAAEESWGTKGKHELRDIDLTFQGGTAHSGAIKVGHFIPEFGKCLHVPRDAKGMLFAANCGNGVTRTSLDWMG
jgi:hypothetical protein